MAITTASRRRIPHRCSNSNSRVSRAVKATPQGRGRPKSSWRAMALPTSSAKSQATMASSARSHRGMRRREGSFLAQASARSMPEAMPSLQHRDCSTMAIRLETPTTHSSL